MCGIEMVKKSIINVLLIGNDDSIIYLSKIKKKNINIIWEKDITHIKEISNVLSHFDIVFWDSDEYEKNNVYLDDTIMNKIILMENINLSPTREVACLKIMKNLENLECVEVLVDPERDISVLKSDLEFFFKEIDKKLFFVDYKIYSIASRVMVSFLIEAIRMVENSLISIEELDQIAIYGMGMKKGPLQLADEIGLDKLKQELVQLENQTGEYKYRPSYLLNNMIHSNVLGKYSGEGFYKW